jgi:hypothetical protein
MLLPKQTTMQTRSYELQLPVRYCCIKPTRPTLLAGSSPPPPPLTLELLETGQPAAGAGAGFATGLDDAPSSNPAAAAVTWLQCPADRPAGTFWACVGGAGAGQVWECELRAAGRVKSVGAAVGTSAGTTAVNFSRSGQYLLMGSADGRVRLQPAAGGFSQQDAQ